MRNYFAIIFSFILQLNLMIGYGYTHEYVHRRAVPSHQQTSYISPVMYQAKASFSPPRHQDIVVRYQVQRDNVNVRHHVPREVVVRHHVPVAYQTYDRRALDVQQPAPGYSLYFFYWCQKLNCKDLLPYFNKS